MQTFLKWALLNDSFKKQGRKHELTGFVAIAAYAHKFRAWENK